MAGDALPVLSTTDCAPDLARNPTRPSTEPKPWPTFSTVPSGLVTALCISCTGAEHRPHERILKRPALLDFLQGFDCRQLVHAHGQHVHARDSGVAEFGLDDEAPKESLERNGLGNGMQRSFQQWGRRENGSREHGPPASKFALVQGYRFHRGDGARGK